MKRLILLIIFLFPLDALAFSPALDAVLSSGPMAAACTGSTNTGFAPYQNFETATTGYDNSESWTEGVGTNGIVDEVDATSPVARGTQQLKIYAGDSGQISQSRYSIATASGIRSDHFRFWFHTAPAGSGDIFFIYYDNGISNRLSLTLNTNRTVTIAMGTGTATTSGALSVDTLYDVFVNYTKGTGADGVYSVGIVATPGSGDVAAPTSGTLYAAGTNGSSTADVKWVSLQARVQATHYFDWAIGRNTTIDSVCN